jgi:3-oxoacyl-[acyl-carrier protein] reductase
MDSKLSLKDKVVLVTGASGGIGLQIAKDLIGEGAIVGAHYRRNLEGAKELLAIGGAGRCKLFQADFSKTDQVLKLYSEFMEWSGTKIDVLINNAGEVALPMELCDITEEAWDHVFQVNTKAPFLLSRAALFDMTKQKHGRIINISSIGVKYGGGKATLHYSASKAALEAITRSLAKAGAPCNVLVNALRVGVTETPLHEKNLFSDMDARVKLIPLKRFAAPSEIASIVLFLASDLSSYITNSVIDVAGGE